MIKSTTEIRQIFLDFFCSKGHKLLTSSSLIPYNDPTLLFTNSGMNQFKNIFLGIDSILYKRVTTVQRCVRAGGKHNDLKNVGYTEYHHTFFEMLGNFSFGDYFKYDAIKFAWELLTSKQWFNIPKEKLWITVYETDTESYDIWVNKLKIPTDRIIIVGNNKGGAYASDNFWQMNDTGPCGPCSEIFYDYGDTLSIDFSCNLKGRSNRYIEIWNLVFIQFNRQVDGTMVKLPILSVDTGMGLERIASVLQHVNSNYDIDLFKKLITAVIKVTGISNNKALRVIADHIRSCAFLISDGVLPSNEGRGYVLRRIIRRAIRHGITLGVKGIFFYKLVSPLIEVMHGVNSDLQSQQMIIERILKNEEEQFTRILSHGLSLLNKEISKLDGNILDGEIVFRLHDTYGLPLDLTEDVCREYKLCIDRTGFTQAMEKQRKSAYISNKFINVDHKSILINNLDKLTFFSGYEQLNTKGLIVALFSNGKIVNSIHENEEAIVILDKTTFYAESGGQEGDKGKLTNVNNSIFQVNDTQKYGKSYGHIGKIIHGSLSLGELVLSQVDYSNRNCISLNHSATHLLHSSLRLVLGQHVKQNGSSLNSKYLRFDFLHNNIIQKEQIRKIEEIVNKQIRYNLLIQATTMTLMEAEDKGAIALFNNKYDTNKVRVITMGDFSIELCGGTHATRTGDIGLFRIISECSIGAGIYRIEAITGEKALNTLCYQSNLLFQVTQLMKTNTKELLNKITSLQKHTLKLEKNIEKFQKEFAMQKIDYLKENVQMINGVKILVSQLDNVGLKMLYFLVNDLKSKLGSAIIILITVVDTKLVLLVGVTKDLISSIKANEIIIHLVKHIGGKGGGCHDLAQAGGGNIAALTNALNSLNKLLAIKL